MTVRLCFSEDPNCGRPRLRVDGLRLGSDDLAALEAELNRRYEQLLQHDSDDLFQFESPSTAIPRSTRFTVSIQRDRHQRCPAVTLEPTETIVLRQPAAPINSLPYARHQRWTDGFVEELDREFSESATGALPRADRVALNYVVDDLRLLSREHPQTVVSILVAGYIALAERMSLQTDRRQLGLYRLAERALDTLTSLRFEAAVDDGDARQSDRRDRFKLMLRRTARVLARILGINQPATL